MRLLVFALAFAVVLLIDIFDRLFNLAPFCLLLWSYLLVLGGLLIAERSCRSVSPDDMRACMGGTRRTYGAWCGIVVGGDFVNRGINSFSELDCDETCAVAGGRRGDGRGLRGCNGGGGGQLGH
jgi:hypothetical protein